MQIKLIVVVVPRVRSKTSISHKSYLTLPEAWFPYMIATIAVIAAIAEEKKKFSDCSDLIETTFQQSWRSQQQRSLI